MSSMGAISDSQQAPLHSSQAVIFGGGFLEAGETWQQGCARELLEETGVVVTADEIRLVDVGSALKVDRPSDSVLLVFGEARERSGAEVGPLVANDEVGEMVVIRAPVELAFPLHTRAVREWFARRG